MTDTGQKDQGSYNITIEDAGPARKRITITAPTDFIAEKLQASLGNVSSTVSLPGFRKGKAPASLLQRRFGTAIREEVRDQILSEGYSAALSQYELQPVSEPEAEQAISELEIIDGQDFTCHVAVEVVPDFDLPMLEGLRILRPVLEVEEAFIDAELSRLQVQHGTIVNVEDKTREGDRIIATGSAVRGGDDTPFFEHDEIDILVPGVDTKGRGQVLGLLIDDMTEKVTGRSIDDTLHFETTGPDLHEREDIRGAALSIDLTITRIERIIPAETAALQDMYSLESEDALRQQIRLALEGRLAQEQQGAMREQVYEQFEETCDFELPENLSRHQVARMLEQQRLEMLYKGGVSVDAVETRLAELRADAENEVHRRLKRSFLLHRIAKHLEVDVTEQEINGRIVEIARQRHMRPEQARKELGRTGALQQLATQIRDHKTADRIIQDAAIKDIPADEWNRMKNADGGASKPSPKKKSTAGKKTSRGGKPATGKKAASSRKAPTGKTSGKKSPGKTSSKAGKSPAKKAAKKPATRSGKGDTGT